jgi:hypothetical protein
MRTLNTYTPHHTPSLGIRAVTREICVIQEVGSDKRTYPLARCDGSSRPIDCKKTLFRFKRTEGLGEVKSKSDSLVQ